MFYTTNRNEMDIYKITLLLVCLVTSYQTKAQHVLTKENSFLRSGDVICKQEVEYLEQGSSGRDVVWDFRDIDILKKKYMVEYSSNSLLQLFKYEPTFMEQYKFEGDTLFKTKYENPITNVSYNKPIPDMIYPMAYGNIHTVEFEGKGTYCHRNCLSTSGSILLEADANGIILFSEQDTLRNVLRVHTQTISTIGIEKDSVITDSTKWIRCTEDTYRWYARGYRYPLFETYNQVLHDGLRNIRHTRASFRTPPDILRLLNDSINQEFRHIEKSRSNSETKAIPYSIKVTGNKVTINYSLTSRAIVKALISDSKGIIYRQQTRKDEVGKDYSLSLNLEGLRRGEYILYVNINGTVYSNTILHNF